MNENIAKIQRAGSNDEIVHLILETGAELPASLPFVEKILLGCIEKKDLQIVVDMVNITLPPAKFIAMLLETTSEVRRMGGDIKFVNVSNSVRNNLMTFSALTYLSLEASEQYALREFDAKLIPLPEKRKKVIEKTRTAISIDSKKRKGRSDKIDLNIDAAKEDSIRVASTIDSLYELCDFVTQHAAIAGIEKREIGKIKVTVYEACLNVVEHAYFSNPDNYIETTVKYNKEKFIIIIHDWGESFEFNPDRQYDVEMAVKDRKTGGFGLHIIKRTVDEIEYLSGRESGNRLILVKYLK